MGGYSKLSAVILCLFVIGTGVPALASDAAAPVSAFQSGLVEVMKNADKLGVKGRFKELRPLVGNNFNMPFMGALAAGTSWKSATSDQRQRFVATFERVSVATLATLFSGYSGEYFTVTGEREGPGIVFVDTDLHLPESGKTVKLTYVSKKFDEGWRLIDVIVDGGISELKVRISEYNLTLRTEGLDGLIRLLDGKADELLE